MSSNIIQVASANTDLAAVAESAKRGRGGKGFGHETPGGSDDVEWYTPNWVFEAMGIKFDMDLSAPMEVPFWLPQWIRRFVNKEEDGLKVEMTGTVWNNPPYGDLAGQFFERMANHGDGMGLVFCRPGSAWFQEYVLKRSSAIFYFRNRIKFWGADGKPKPTWCKKKQQWKVSSPGADSVLVAWGDLCADVLIEIEQTQRIEGVTVDHRTGRWW